MKTRDWYFGNATGDLNFSRRHFLGPRRAPTNTGEGGATATPSSLSGWAVPASRCTRRWLPVESRPSRSPHLDGGADRHHANRPPDPSQGLPAWRSWRQLRGECPLSDDRAALLRLSTIERLSGQPAHGEIVGNQEEGEKSEGAAPSLGWVPIPCPDERRNAEVWLFARRSSHRVRCCA